LQCRSESLTLCSAPILFADAAIVRKIDVAQTPGGTPESAESAGETQNVVIKKYANRRLYNTATSSYVTLDHLSEMVREGIDFQVLDARSGDDITRSVLTQIIFEQESKGQNLLPVKFLRRLIRFYGDQMQGFLPPYLEMSMESFSKSQEQFREHFSRTFGGKTPIAAFEEQARQNMALFQKAMSVWTPFTAVTGARPATGAEDETPAAVPGEEAVSELKKQVEAMQKQLDALSNPRKP
jgi:polyhydroxyalkanoate synthesis repressor PhaR